jgi:hypothetical protein
MNRSSIAAISLGATTTVFIGVAASLLLPLAGLVAGAYFAATAVAAAGMGTAATWALGAAGAAGGLMLGRVSKPLAIWMAIGFGFVVGGITKAVGAMAGFLARFLKIKKHLPAGTLSRLKKTFHLEKLKKRFNAATGKGVNNNPAAPKTEPSSKPAL